MLLGFTDFTADNSDDRNRSGGRLVWGAPSPKAAHDAPMGFPGGPRSAAAPPFSQAFLSRLPGQDPHMHPLPAPHSHRTRTARGSALSAGGRRHLAAAGPGVREGGKIPKDRGMGVAAPSRCLRGQGELGLRGPPASQGGRDAACGRRCQHPLPPAANVSCVSAAQREGKVWQ